MDAGAHERAEVQYPLICVICAGVKPAMSCSVSVCTPSFSAFAWAALNLASGSFLTAPVLGPRFTVAQRGEARQPN